MCVLTLALLGVGVCPSAWPDACPDVWAAAPVPAQRYILAQGEALPAYHVGQKLTGTSAWYGQRAQGHWMANGARFDLNKMTAAHRTLPFGTKIRVTNTKNGKSVVLTITDRGPATRRYMLDVTRGAAEKLSMRRAGEAPVTVEILALPKWYKAPE